MQKIVVLLCLATLVGETSAVAACRQFSCQAGATARTDLKHTPSSNGCGPYGLGWMGNLYAPWFHQCCNFHDICFSTCLTNKDTCDNDFKNCMKSACQKLANGDDKTECFERAALFYKLVGETCVFFDRAQKKACTCVSSAPSTTHRSIFG